MSKWFSPFDRDTGGAGPSVCRSVWHTSFFGEHRAGGRAFRRKAQLLPRRKRSPRLRPGTFSRTSACSGKRPEQMKLRCWIPSCSERDAPEDSVKKADERRIELTRFTEQERAIEKLLVAKGFEDAAAFVQEGTATIVVKKEKLTDEEIARILEMAMRQTGQEASNIKIIPAG